MKQRSKYESNWLVVFLTTLVCVWLFQQVTGTIDFVLRTAWDNPVSQIIWLMVGRLWLNNIATLIVLAALITSISVLNKWKVLWPVVAGFALNWAWSAIGVNITSNLDVMLENDNFWLIAAAVGPVIRFTAVLVTFFLVWRHNKKTQPPATQENWLAIFLSALVCVWLFRQIFSVLFSLLWAQHYAGSAHARLFIAVFNLGSIVLALIALIIVISKLRKWSALWPVPVAFALVSIALPAASQIAIYLVTAALTFLLVRRYNKKASIQNIIVGECFDETAQ
ncbi:MAG: hypothetical protein FWD06_00600 [Oscillospiraceae bacterium]|nr:hypothetical protein [Oscillospiraceae bacterium]